MGKPSALAFDAREEYAGEPGMHALIIGVSDYINLPARSGPLTPHQEQYGLGLRKLSRAAWSAFLVYRWLIDNRADLPVPLQTCRLLLSPTDGEFANVPADCPDPVNATADAVAGAAKAWRADAATRPDNMTFFYFAGHGFQTTRGNHVLMLADVGDGVGGLLKNAIDASLLIDGMAPARRFEDVARQQFYFLDACRMLPQEASWHESLLTYALWDPPKIEQRDDRVTAVYHTTEPGAPAFSVPDDQSYFSKALLSCLEGDGAEEVAPGQWGVTAASLARGLEHHMKLIESKYKRHQRVQFTNATSVAVLRHFGGIPQMSFDVEVVPQQLAPHVEIHVSDSNLSEEGRFGPPLEPHPFPVCLAIGPYLVKTKRTGQTPDADPVGRLMTVSCPPQPWLLRV